jgi:DNA repair exonuclease SbcCD ATPase subunit/predicted phosphodiesterase
MKILQAQDIHVSPNWLSESKQHIARICEVAKSEKVDAITIAGDFFDKPLMASDRNNYNEILQLGRDLQNSAPVFYVTGTPKHDAPGCYSAFNDIGWEEVSIGKHHVIGDLMIMGIPEITPAVLMANYPELPKQDINVKQYELVNELIEKYYAPLAHSHNGSVLFMGHGHIAGTKFRDDQKPRSTDFMFSEEMLNRIGADNIQFGHLHLPQKYYGGSAHMTWGDLGFKPGFNVVEFGPISSSVKRFDYGEPIRIKLIAKLLEELKSLSIKPDQEINLWLDIECDKAFADQFDCSKSLEELHEKFNLGPLSKITTNIQHTENIRVDVEEYEACKTLEDLYKLYNPDVPDSILLKVAEAQEATGAETEHIEQHNFEFLDLYMKGSKAGLENGVEEIKIDFNDFNTGANLIVGPNGTGKSFNLGFMTPFSIHLPTGCDLKSLFELKDSQILRRFKDGNDIITQKIVIDPTLASPTAKYYMDINGKPIETVTGNKAPFDDAVNEIFGSIKMFMTCAFRGQKENNNYPSLENAKETDLRKIFTELSGIDRTPLKDYAHEKAGILKKEIELDLREIQTLESVVEDKDQIELLIDQKNDSRLDNEESLNKYKTLLSDRNHELSSYDSVVSENNSIGSQLSTLNSEGQGLTADIALLEYELGNVDAILNEASETRIELEEIKKVQSKHTIASGAYYEAQGAYNKVVEEYQEEKETKNKKLVQMAFDGDEVKRHIRENNEEITQRKGLIKVKESVIESANEPCEHCGKISSSAQDKIDTMNNEIESMNKFIDSMLIKNQSYEKDLEKLRADYSNLKATLPEKPEPPQSLTDLKLKMESLNYDNHRLKNLEHIIMNLKSSEDKKINLENEISQKKTRLNEVISQTKELESKIKPVDTAVYESLKSEILSIEQSISDNIGEISRLDAEIEALRNQLKKSLEREEKIKTLRLKCDNEQKNITEWEEIEKAFSPKGIPALELSLIAPVINRDANTFLSKYQPRYSVEIITQDFDSKNNLAEKFKILIHDSKASDVKSIAVVSGGQAVWSTSALREAINISVIKRTGRNYLYGIIDEQDGALDNNIVADFYSMINDSLAGKKKLISVSHNIEAISTISNVVEVTDFFVKGENNG